MADYIRGNILAQSYAHLYEVEFSDRAIGNIRRLLSEKALEIARDSFKVEVEISVETIPGSLKTKITATVKSIGTAIIIYGGMRNGIDYLVSDGKAFAHRVNEVVVKESRQYGNPHITLEARTGVPGVLKGIVSELDYLAWHTRGLSRRERSERIKRVEGRTLRLLENIESDENHGIIIRELQEVVTERSPHAPIPRELPDKRRPPALPPPQDELLLFFEELKKGRRKALPHS